MRILLSMALLLFAAPTFAQERLSGSNVDIRIGQAAGLGEASGLELSRVVDVR